MKTGNNTCTRLFLAIKKLSLVMCIFSMPLFLNAQSQFIGIEELVIKGDSSASVFFMTGEYHGYSSNQSVEAAYIKYLSLNHNVRTILREEGYGYTYLLRKYLYTGDTAFLNLFISDRPFNFEETRRFVFTLKQINDQLPINQKLNLIPIDVTENDRLPYVKNFFKIIINREVFNQSLKEAIDSLIESEYFPGNIIAIKSILTNYHDSIDYSVELDSIVNSYIHWQFIKKDLFKQRQYYLYKNIIKAQPFFKGNIYGNFGNAHTVIEPKCMAYYLKSDTSFKYHLTIANPYYYDCKSVFANHSRYRGFFHKRYFKRTIKSAKLSKGIYTAKVKGETYIIHVNQPEMMQLK